MNETSVTITGNVITDVRSRLAGEGVRVASFRMASNERRYDKAAGEWVDGDRLYVTVTCWRKLAQNVVSSLFKGDPVMVTGRLYTRGYEVEGQKRSVTEVEATAVGPDLSRCSAELARPRRLPAEDAQRSQEARAGEAPGEPERPAADPESSSASAGAAAAGPVLVAVGGS